MSNPADHTLLVLRAQSGDREALDRLLRQVQRPLFRSIRAIVGRRETAEDVLQEVFLILCRELPWLREPRFFCACLVYAPLALGMFALRAFIAG